MSLNLTGKLGLDGSQFIKEMKDATREVTEHQRKIKEANKTINDFQKNLGGAGSSISSMMSSLRSGDLMGFTSSAKSAVSSIQAMIPAAGGATASITALGTAVKTAMGPIGWIIAGVGAAVGVVGGAISSVEGFNKSLKGLSALTGVTGGELDEMGNAAIDMSTKFGTSASGIVDSMKMIGSQAPQLLKDMDALKEVTSNAIVLSKSTGGDMGVEESAKAITTVMNQMKVAGSEAESIINTLAAGSKAGAGDVAYLTTAIEKSGTQANLAGMTYQQLVGAIETLAPKFSSAEVAGTGLNTMLIRLSTQSESKFNPAVVGIEKALENLEKANLSAEQKVKLFGQSALTVANTLIQNRKAFSDMTEAVTGSSTAYDQMNTLGGTLETTWNKLKSSWDALMISLGQNQIIQACIAILGGLVFAIKGLIDAVRLVVTGITTLFDIIIALFKKLWDSIKPYWDSIVSTITDSAVYKACVKIWKGIYDYVKGVIQRITKLWNDFMNWLGLKSNTPVEQKVEVKVDDSEVKEMQKVLGTTTKTKGGKTKIDYDSGSLEAYKKKLQELQEKLSKKKVSLIDAQKINQEIDQLRQKIEEKEIELGVRAKRGSLEDIDNQISKIDQKLKTLNPTIDKAEIEELQVKKSALEKVRKDTEAAINGVVIQGKKFETKGSSGSLQEAQDKVSYYKQRIQLEVEGSENYEYLKKQIQEWTKKEKEIRLRVEADTSTLNQDSLKFMSDKVSRYKAELEATAYGTPEYYEKLKELKEWTEKEKEVKLKLDLDTSGAKQGSLKEITTRLSDLKARLDLEVYGSKEYNEIKSQVEELTKKENKIRIQMEVDGMDAFDKIQTGLEGFHAIDGIVNSFSSLNQAIEEGANAWDIFMAAISVIESILSGINTVMQITNMLTNLGTAASIGKAAADTAAGTAATTEAGLEAATIAPKTAETVANKALEASILDLAAAQIFAAHAAIPFVGVGLATGFVSAMMAAMAAQHAASLSLQALEGGGIIKGKSTVGDQNLLVTRVNGNEMVLNTRQQNNLFRAIDNNRLGQANTPFGQVEFILQGDKLVGLIKNHEKITKKSLK